LPYLNLWEFTFFLSIVSIVFGLWLYRAGCMERKKR